MSDKHRTATQLVTLSLNADVEAALEDFRRKLDAAWVDAPARVRQALEAAHMLDQFDGTLTAGAPSRAQARAGNYAKRHVTVHGLPVTIENEAGSIRDCACDACDAEEPCWSQIMAHDYGYIRGARGADKDHVDAFLSDNPESSDVAYVVNQATETGRFDEHKCMLGFASETAALKAYYANYPPEHFDRVLSVRAMPIAMLKLWLQHGNMRIEAARATEARLREQDDLAQAYFDGALDDNEYAAASAAYGFTFDANDPLGCAPPGERLDSDSEARRAGRDIDALGDPEFDESKVVRDEQGRFSEKGGADAAPAEPPPAAAQPAAEPEKKPDWKHDPAHASTMRRAGEKAAFARRYNRAVKLGLPLPERPAWLSENRRPRGPKKEAAPPPNARADEWQALLNKAASAARKELEERVAQDAAKANAAREGKAWGLEGPEVPAPEAAPAPAEDKPADAAPDAPPPDAPPPYAGYSAQRKANRVYEDDVEERAKANAAREGKAWNGVGPGLRVAFRQGVRMEDAQQFKDRFGRRPIGGEVARVKQRDQAAAVDRPFSEVKAPGAIPLPGDRMVLDGDDVEVVEFGGGLRDKVPGHVIVRDRGGEHRRVPIDRLQQPPVPRLIPAKLDRDIDQLAKDLGMKRAANLDELHEQNAPPREPTGVRHARERAEEEERERAEAAERERAARRDAAERMARAQGSLGEVERRAKANYDRARAPLGERRSPDFNTWGQVAADVRDEWRKAARRDLEKEAAEAAPPAAPAKEWQRGDKALVDRWPDIGGGPQPVEVVEPHTPSGRVVVRHPDGQHERIERDRLVPPRELPVAEPPEPAAAPDAPSLGDVERRAKDNYDRANAAGDFPPWGDVDAAVRDAWRSAARNDLKVGAPPLAAPDAPDLPTRERIAKGSAERLAVLIKRNDQLPLPTRATPEQVLNAWKYAEARFANIEKLKGKDYAVKHFHEFIRVRLDKARQNRLKEPPPPIKTPPPPPPVTPGIQPKDGGDRLVRGEFVYLGDELVKVYDPKPNAQGEIRVEMVEQNRGGPGRKAWFPNKRVNPADLQRRRPMGAKRHRWRSDPRHAESRRRAAEKGARNRRAGRRAAREDRWGRQRAYVPPAPTSPETHPPMKERPTAEHHARVREALKQPDIKVMRPLGEGGINPDKFIARAGGIKVKLVPKWGFRHDQVRREHGIPAQTDHINELASQVVNDAMDQLVDMPNIEVRDVEAEWEGKRMGDALVQEYRDGNPVMHGWGNARPEEIEDMAIFDTIIGNTDRHGKNALFDDAGHLIAIDQGYAFALNGLDAGFGNFVPMKRYVQRYPDRELRPRHKAALAKLIDQRETVTKALKATRLQQNQIDAFWKRVDLLQTTGKLPPFYDERGW